jgi:choline-sulfatase
MLREFEAILRGMLDPEAVDRRAKEDQSAMIARHGGREAVLKAKSPIATPAPAVDLRFTSE